MTLDGNIAGYVLILGVAFAVHEPWRWLGAYLGQTLRPDDEIFLWVKAVSTALIAGLVLRLIVFPAGVLETVPLLARTGAGLAGVAVFYASGRNLLVGILAGCATLGLGASLFHALG